MAEPRIEIVYLRLILRRDKDAVADFDPTDCDLDYADSLLETAFALAVRRRFSPATPVRELTSLALGVRQTIGVDEAPPVIVLEMILRAALGERVPLDDLTDNEISLAQAHLLAQLVHHMGMLDGELDSLLAEAATA